MNAIADKLNQFDRLQRLFLQQTEDHAVVTLDENGRVSGCNAAAARLFGHPATEMIGNEYASLFGPDAIAADEPRRILQAAAKRGRADCDGWRRRKDGQSVFVHAVLTRIQQDSAHCFVELARDFTSHKRKESQQLAELDREKAARAAAESSARMKDALLATLSHELRTPLTAILLWSRILRGAKISEKDRQQAIETIERSANAQSEMIEDLLDISRIISGKLRLNLRLMELTSAVQAALEAVRGMADAKGIALVSELDPQSGSVRADPVRIQQVAWNLLTNAVRFTPPGGCITVTLRRVDVHVRLTVADTGSGISAQLLPKVFDRSPRAKTPAPSYDAVLNLGLAITRQLVELHGGDLRAHSPGEDRGATFTVDLPQAPVAESDAADPAMKEPFSSSELLHGLHIMVVEDQGDTRNVIRWLLEQSGAQVQAVESAAQAMKILNESQATSIDVLLSDIGMDGEDGLKMIRKIRALEAARSGAKSMPAIAVTAYATAEDRRRALRAGYQAFLAKPIDPNDLIQLVVIVAGRQNKSESRE